MPKEIYKNRVLDARPDRLDLRDREYRPPLVSLPDAWPLKKDYKQLFALYKDNKMVLDQGSDGACTGFGLAATINYLFIRELFDNNVKIDPELMQNKQVSPKMLYNMARIYDEWDGEDYEGSSCRGAMKGWHRHGVCKKTTWPHTVKSNDTNKYPLEHWSKESVETPLGAYYRINKDSVSDMQAAIKEVGAIYCSAIIQKGWWINKQDNLSIIKHTTDKIGGHAFAILGYNKDGFIVQNSWGEKWGYNGFAIISYKEWVENGQDAWVAVLGAKLNLNASPHTFSNYSLQTIGSDHTNSDNRIIARALNYNYTKSKIKPWSEEKAYKHTLVIGNNGRPKLTIVSTSSPEESAKFICYTSIKKWMKKSSSNRKIAIYAHGGLNNEQASINRIRIMAPYFKENNIYPIFVTWKTGFIESISNQIKDNVNNMFFGVGNRPSEVKAKGIFDGLQESLDRSIEKIAREVLVRGVWSEMKENAKFASDRAVPGYAQHGNTKAGAMVLMSKELKRLKDEFNCEIHLVGHSAGSILFGHWMDELTKRELSVDSLTLYAPACTVEFANRHYLKACSKNTLSLKNITMHMMNDERELADNVTVYKKSLLYLVSRALENIHKTPLLGMAAAWDVSYAKKRDLFNSATYADINKWNKLSKGVKCYVYGKEKSKVQTSLRDDYTDLAHGSFDNDIKVIEQTIKEILGTDTLKFKVENLNGF